MMDPRTPALAHALTTLNKLSSNPRIWDLLIFLIVAENPGATVTMVMNKTNLSVATVSRTLADFATPTTTNASGWVAYEIDDRDARKKMFYLTPAGQKLLQEAMSMIE